MVTSRTPKDHGAVEPIEVVVDLQTDVAEDTVRRIVEYAEQDYVVAQAAQEDSPLSVHLAGDEPADVDVFGRVATARTTDGETGTITLPSHTWKYGEEASPVHAFLGSLFACLASFVRDNAMEKDLRFKEIVVEAAIPSKFGRIDAIERDVGLETTVADNEVSTLVENATRDCVVEDRIAKDAPVDVDWSLIE